MMFTSSIGDFISHRKQLQSRFNNSFNFWNTLHQKLISGKKSLHQKLINTHKNDLLSIIYAFLYFILD